MQYYFRSLCDFCLFLSFLLLCTIKVWAAPEQHQQIQPATANDSNNNILVAFGGEYQNKKHTNGIQLKSVEAFSIDGNYSRISGLANMTRPIGNFHYTVFNNTIYLTGGIINSKQIYNNKVFSYNINTNTWNGDLLPLLPTTGEFEGDSALVTVKNQLLYITSQEGIYALNMLNITEWKKLPSTVPQVLIDSGFAAAVAAGDSIFLFDTIFNSVYRSDDGTTSWREMKSKMLKTANSPGVATLLNGTKIIMVGGGLTRKCSKTVQIYDVESDTWQRASSMNKVRCEMAIAGVPAGLPYAGSDGSAVVCGGFRTDGQVDFYRKSCEVYDFHANQWRIMANGLRLTRSFFGLQLLVRKS